MSTILLHYSYGAIIASLILAIFLMAKGYHADKRLLEQRLANTQDRLLNKIYKIQELQLKLFKEEDKPHSVLHDLKFVESKSPTYHYERTEPPKPPIQSNHYPRSDSLYHGHVAQAHWMIQPGVAYSDDSRNTCSSSDSSSSDSSSSSSGGCE